MPHQDYCVVVLFADQPIVFLVEGEAVVLDIFQGIALLSKFMGRTDVVIQLGSVFLFVFIADFLQFLLPQTGILPFVYYLLPLQFCVDLGQEFHQPLRQPEQFVVVAVF